MPMGKLNNVEDYSGYKFVYVECNVCGQKSVGFVHKPHFGADETLEYIEQVTGFAVNKVIGGSDRANFTSIDTNHDIGGLICTDCRSVENTLEEVANG